MCKRRKKTGRRTIQRVTVIIFMWWNYRLSAFSLDFSVFFRFSLMRMNSFYKQKNTSIKRERQKGWLDLLPNLKSAPQRTTPMLFRKPLFMALSRRATELDGDFYIHIKDQRHVLIDGLQIKTKIQNMLKKIARIVKSILKTSKTFKYQCGPGRTKAPHATDQPSSDALPASHAVRGSVLSPSVLFPQLLPL